MPDASRQEVLLVVVLLVQSARSRVQGSVKHARASSLKIPHRNIGFHDTGVPRS